MRYFVISVVWLAVACGGSSNPTLGEACSDLGTAFCAELTRCGADPAEELTCASAFVSACCVDEGTCDAEGEASAEELDACVEDLPDASCQALVDGVLPPACLIL